MKNMTSKPAHKKLVAILFFSLALLCTSFSASAVILKIISMDEIIEVSEIKISVKGNKSSGTVTVTKCSKCPMKLDFDSKTKFTYKGQPVSAKKARRHEKKDSLVSYDPVKNHVIKVVWQ